MDHDNLNDMIDEWLGDGDGPPPPTWRATIRGRRLMLTHWAPWLAQGGPQAKLLTEREEAGFTIADLTVHGEDDDEVSVRFYAVGAELERAEQVLVRWAEAVGYRRIWLSDRLVTIEPDPERLGARVGPLPDLPGDLEGLLAGVLAHRQARRDVPEVVPGLRLRAAPVGGQRPPSPPASTEARRRRGLVAVRNAGRVTT